MKIVGSTLVSEDLKQAYFACNLSACHGNCCVEGDAGAPLEESEISILEDYIDDIKPFMEKDGLHVIEKYGVFDYDAEGEYVTPLVNDKQCAFVVKENGVNFCTIEKAFLAGKTPFQKPVSCHLYPVRLSKVGEFTAVNYHKWSICAPALINGKKEGKPLFQYLKVPLTRKFGKEWFEELEKQMQDKP